MARRLGMDDLKGKFFRVKGWLIDYPYVHGNWERREDLCGILQADRFVEVRDPSEHMLIKIAVDFFDDLHEGETEEIEPLIVKRLDGTDCKLDLNIYEAKEITE